MPHTKEHSVAILVSSCDKYRSAWEPFFRLLAIQWPDCPYSLYLCTETLDYSCDFLPVTTVQTGKDLSWTERIRTVLDRIPEENILFFLEDFFLTQPVNESRLNEILTVFEAHHELGFLFLEPNPFYFSHYKGKELAPDIFFSRWNFSYRVNASMGLWRKEFLRQMLYMPLNPWKFETTGSLLSLFSDYRVGTVAPGDAPAFDYCLNPANGLGIVQGVWLRGNRAFFEKYGIPVNFDELGIAESDKTYGSFMSEEQVELDRNLSTGPRIRRLYYRLGWWYRRCPPFATLKMILGFRRYCRRLKKETHR